MTRLIFESKSNRKTVYKTEKGIEIKPMLHSKDVNERWSTNITYYYVFYNYSKENRIWKVYTNPELYGEIKIIDTFNSKEDAIKTADAINSSIRFLFENI